MVWCYTYAAQVDATRHCCVGRSRRDRSESCLIVTRGRTQQHTTGIPKESRGGIRWGRDRLWLAGSQLVAGGATYGMHGLLARSMTPAEYGLFGVLWSATFLTSQLLFVPLQYGLIYFVSDFRSTGRRGMSAVRGFAPIFIVLTLLLLLIGVVAAPLLLRELFEQNMVVLTAFLGSVALYAGTYLLRGAVMGASRFGLAAAQLAVETLLRLLGAALLVVVLGLGLTGASLTVVLGAAATLLVLPVVMPRVSPLLRSGAPGSLTARTALSVSLPTLIVVGAQQLVLNGPALVLQAAGADPIQEALPAFYAGLILSRIPQYIFGPLTAALLPDFTSQSREPGPDAFAALLTRTVVIIIALGALMSAGFWLLGPLGMAVLYGSEYQLGRQHLALLAAGMGLYMLADALHVAMLARGKASYSAATWLLSIAGFLLPIVVFGASSLYAIELAIITGVLIPALTLLWLHIKLSRSHS